MHRDITKKRNHRPAMMAIVTSWAPWQRSCRTSTGCRARMTRCRPRRCHRGGRVRSGRLATTTRGDAHGCGHSQRRPCRDPRGLGPRLPGMFLSTSSARARAGAEKGLRCAWSGEGFRLQPTLTRDVSEPEVSRPRRLLGTERLELRAMTDQIMSIATEERLSHDVDRASDAVHRSAAPPRHGSTSPGGRCRQAPLPSSMRS